MKINYFFGSDSRSINAYEILSEYYIQVLNKDINNLNVITLDNPNKVRNKVVRNPFETYCLNNSINYKYYDPSVIYDDLETALVCSFGAIFNKEFLSNNNIKLKANSVGKTLLNLHMSILPDLKGPTPIEYALMYEYKSTGISLFAIDEGIDTGQILWTKSFKINKNDYASDLYNKSFNCFKEFMLDDNLSKDILMKSESIHHDNNKKVKKTYKIDTCDLQLNNLSVANAKIRIRALDYIGPAVYELEPNLSIKVHSYTDDNKGLPLELNDGILYVNYITPPGKNKMKALDWLRGRK